MSGDGFFPDLKCPVNVPGTATDDEVALGRTGGKGNINGYARYLECGPDGKPKRKKRKKKRDTDNEGRTDNLDIIDTLDAVLALGVPNANLQPQQQLPAPQGLNPQQLLQPGFGPFG